MATYQLGFVDTETIPGYKDFNDMPEELARMYERKFGHELANNDPDKFDNFEDHYRARAALYPEFGKIVCLVIGVIFVDDKDKQEKLKLKTLCGRHEDKLLAEAAPIIDKFDSLVGHNSKEFDFPYLCKRFYVHGIQLPQILNIAGKKPWEVSLIDTMELWRFGSFKGSTSLELFAHCLGLPSPKQDMTGADVAKVYYEMFDHMKDGELPFEAESAAIQKIGKYCQGDVVTLANCYRKLKYQSVIASENVIYS